MKVIVKKASSCPPATQDSEKNLKNRQHAIDEYGYGPANPSLPNEEFWAKKADMWNEPIDVVRTMLCSNCAAFDSSDKMKNCIKKGAKDSGGLDNFETVIDEAELGYCKMYKFKCAASRTCDSWVTKEKPKNASKDN